MVLYDVYKRPLVVVHKTSVCSKATLFLILCILLTVISPFLIVYRSQGLWIKHAEYREQADVHFKHQVLIVSDTASGPLVWSNQPSFNNLMRKYLRIPLVKSYEEDENHDGVNDRLVFSLNIPLLSNELVYGTTLLLTFDYRLHHMCELIMEGAGLFQHASGVPVSALYVTTDLSLHQRQPLPPSGIHDLYNTSVLPSSVSDTRSWRLQEILSSYWKRNITTKYTNTYTSWQTGQSDSFTINLVVQYPEQTVLYIPGFWYVLKWAWIQYFAVLVILAYVISLIKDWVYQNQVVSTWVQFPSKKER
ncbi:transmembrane protein 231-like [Penaeus chinensis]|uniref:transmembrane protein 231-like n=1 Tax=Penaeus chinensis TaxID=139456 RepID=UPI001FB75FAA|nr:transmembrane protein 231-like [Penaeus chinensis]